MDTMHMNPGQVAMVCPSRRQLTCGRVDVYLGWPATIPIEVCQKCIGLGVDTEAARQVRQDFADSEVARVKTAGLENFHRLVQVSVMGKFMTRTEADRARLAIAASEAALQASEDKSIWDGVPYPRRLIASAIEAGVAFKRKMRSYKGCGCIKAAKRVVKAVVG